MIRVEYVKGNEFRYRSFKKEQIIEMLTKEYSSKDKPLEEVIVDIYNATDPTANENMAEIIKVKVKEMKETKTLVEIVEYVLAPVNKLKNNNINVVIKYCRELDDKEKSRRRLV